MSAPAWPAVCLGGNVFGWTADEEGSFAVLDAALDAGLSFVDTADVYSAWAPGHSGGESEAIIGRWMASRGVRDRVTVATKVGKLEALHDLRPQTVRTALEDSLRRLQTDHVELYYAHEDDGGDLAEALGGFDALVREGKVGQVALSNFSADRVREAVAIAEREGFAKPVATQDDYSLVERGIERDGLLDATRELGLVVLPYFALASGFLTGKYRPGQEVDSARAGGASKHLESERGPRVLAALDEVAEAHEAPVAAVALAWLKAQPGVVSPVASARTVEQVAPLAAALTLELTPAEVTRLTEASAP